MIGLDLVPGADIVADITKVMPIMELDAVVHLAAVAAPNVCEKNPELAFNVNVNGTHKVLRLALELGAKKFVFSSSAHVYDLPPLYLPTDEVHPLRLNNTYTTTKILGEQLCNLFWENYGLSYTILRLFNAYGPGQGLGYFIPDTMEKAKHGNIALHGAETTKDWVYVDDVALAFCAAVETAYVGPINIGTGIETQLLGIAQKIAQCEGVSAIGVPGAEATRMQADYRRAWSVLQWIPRVLIKDGLVRTINAAKESQPVR